MSSEAAIDYIAEPSDQSVLTINHSIKHCVLFPIKPLPELAGIYLKFILITKKAFLVVLQNNLILAVISIVIIISYGSSTKMYLKCISFLKKKS